MYKFICFCLFTLFGSQVMAADVTRTCRVNEVLIANFGATGVDRVHVRCVTGIFDGVDKIFFYALPMSATVKGAAYATQFVNLGNTALTSGRLLNITFGSGDTSGTVYGCRAFDCRKPKNVTIQ